MSLPSLKQYHRKPYTAISPSRPELSQAGNTVVVTGGNSGIGYAIARSFVEASAKHVIILGRRREVVKSAAEKLSKEADGFGSSTVVEGKVCDISSLESTAAFWTHLQNNGIHVDVLVLNAAAGGNTAPILASGLSNVWADYEANVRSAMDFAERFYKQTTKQGASSRKVSLFLSLRRDTSNEANAIVVLGEPLVHRRIYVAVDGSRAPELWHDQERCHGLDPADCQRH